MSNKHFLPGQSTLDYWNKSGYKPIPKTEISVLENRLATKAPSSYYEFMTTFGAVEFGYDIANQFNYFYENSNLHKMHTQLIGYIKSPERALRYYKSLQSDEDLLVPPHLFPFAMDLGQGELFIEFGQSTERIFYWNFEDHDWTQKHIRLGFVANNLYDFINNLVISWKQ